MAFPNQVDVPSKLATTWFGEEAVAYGTASAGMVQIYPLETIGLTPKREQIKNPSESARGHAHKKNIRGYKSSEGKLVVPLKCDTTVLNAGATPATPWLGKILKNLLGGEFSGAGSTIASAADEDTITVAAGHGSRFKRGCWITVVVNGVREPARVLNISTDTLTIYPKLSAVPDASAEVLNSYTYYVTQANARSATVKHAKAAATGGDFQWTHLGGIGDIEVKAENGQILQLMTALKFRNWSGPAAQGTAVTEGTDGMLAEEICRDAVTLLQKTTTLTRQHYALESHSWKSSGGMIHTPQTGGSVEGTRSVMRIPERPFATAAFKCAADESIVSVLAADDVPLTFVCMFPTGSGTSIRYVLIDIPSGVFADEPTFPEDGGRLLTEASLETLEDTTTTTAGLSGTDLDLAKSPVRIVLL